MAGQKYIFVDDHTLVHITTRPLTHSRVTVAMALELQLYRTKFGRLPERWVELPEDN